MLKRNDAGTLTGLINLIAKMTLCARRNDSAGLASLTNELCRDHLRESGRIIEASPRSDGSVAARIRHQPRKDRAPARNPRYFDPLFFAAILLMERCGLGIFYHATSAQLDEREKYYLRLQRIHGHRRGVRPLLARVICDAFVESDARQAGDHHSYLLADLAQRASKGGRVPQGKHGRAAAIKEARAAFEANNSPDLGEITADEVENVLTRLLDTATEYHGQREG